MGLGDNIGSDAGIQYRELLEGTGSKVIGLGSKVSMKCVPLNELFMIEPCCLFPISAIYYLIHSHQFYIAEDHALTWNVHCRYTVYKLSSGAYFKYSSGGTPVLLYALGYGTEGKNDVGETYTFVMGDKEALPIAATLGMVGMRAGGTPLSLNADVQLQRGRRGGMTF